MRKQLNCTAHAEVEHSAGGTLSANQTMIEHTPHAIQLYRSVVGGLRCSVLNRKSAGVPEDAVADRSLRFPAFCNALGERRSQRGRNC